MITQIVEAHPATGSPHNSRRTTMMIRNRKEMQVISIPNQEAMFRGALEKLMMPSTAYLNSFQKLHLVVPAMRSTFSKGSHYVLKPTQPKMPLEKRLYSVMDRMASFMSLVISRKSLAPSTISASEIWFISS